MTSPQLEPLLLIAEVTALLGTDRKTVGKWVKTGELPVVRLPGGHRRYRPADVRALRDGTPPEPPPAAGEDASLLAPAEACAVLRVSPSCLRAWAEQRLIGCQRTAGGHRRYYRADVEALLNGTGGAGQ